VEIQGQSFISRGLNRAAAALRQPGVIHYFIPGLQKVRARKDGSVDFTMSKGVGPFSLTLHGTTRLVAIEAPHRFRLEMSGHHRVGGQVTASFDLHLSRREPGVTDVAYAGQVTANGLTRRILAWRPDLPDWAIQRGFDRLRVDLRREDKVAWAKASGTDPAPASGEG
jgi:carbon monoxide dehydrogenase subunit G